MKEPPRQRGVDVLWEPIRARVRQVVNRLRERGFDPIIFESLRTQERQNWLYGIGRTHDLKRKPVTWTLKSKHITGKAVDLISRSRLWSWPEFFDALAEEAAKVNLHTLDFERCHIEWRG